MAESATVHHIYDRENRHMVLVLHGHLCLESLLNEILSKKLPVPEMLGNIQREGFARKATLVGAIGALKPEIVKLILGLNSLRNKFMHQFSYQCEFEEAFKLVTAAADAGVDFSDEGIFRDRTYSEECYGVEGVLMEVFANTFSHVVWELEDILSVSDRLG